MDLVRFLQAVVPPGRIIIGRMVERTRASGEPYNSIAHVVCSSHEEAASTAMELVGGGHNVYFALASYKQGFHLNTKGKRVVRVRENVQELKALWFDIDFKGEYPDAKTAVFALRAFSQATKMPAPAILVGSGNGLHVYWPLTEPVPLERWQRLADALKEAAKSTGLKADLACTADSCRILRPPGTVNFKDPASPKPVKLLYSSDVEFSPDDLETALLPWVPTAKPAAVQQVAVNSDLAGGVAARPTVPSTFDEIQKHCGVAKWMVEHHGQTCKEPEWMAVLQLLKHCEDGAAWVHPVSDGHPSYNAAATDAKWQHRLANSAGPTLCKTFEQYRPEICAKCPHSGFVKTPLQVGQGNTTDISALPPGWRIAEQGRGVERLMLTDPANNTKEWIKVFRHIPSNFRPVRSVASGQFDMLIDISLKGTDTWTVIAPMSMLGNSRKLVEHLASFGVVLKAKEVAPFGDLMASWLEKLQNARRVADVSEQLGWILGPDHKIVGFACSPTVYYSDGRVRNDIRPAREFATMAKLYEPCGELDAWKKVADFIAKQNSPALTAILAAAFAAPLLKFVGIQGGILSLVSPASGVGKSSALKVSQAVWASPIHAMNSVDDTPKSVAKKLGFVNNLPGYWDELRGKQTVDGFTNLAFQMTQGKEKSRLDSSANLRDAQKWETMLVVASNESIFDAMARRTTGSDAGMVRTFEIEMHEAPQTDVPSAEITLLFETLSHNYGQAGREYAQYLAMHAEKIREAVQEMYLHLADTMEPQERFWYGMVSILLIGAILAGKLGLVNIDVRSLKKFLLANLKRLRERTSAVGQESELNELLSEYLRERGDRLLVIDDFHSESGSSGRPSHGYLPHISTSPRSEKASVVMASESRRVRFSTRDFHNYLESRELAPYGMIEKLVAELGARKIRCVLGYGTKYATPRVWALEIDVTWADFSNPLHTPGSSPSSPPAS